MTIIRGCAALARRSALRALAGAACSLTSTCAPAAPAALPALLLRPGPRGVLWWQWLAAPFALAAAASAGRVLGGATRWVLARLVRRTRSTWDDAVLERLGGPLSLLWALAVLGLGLPLLDLAPPAEAFVERLLGAAFLLAVFWILLRVVKVGIEWVATSAWGAALPSSRALVPLVGRVLNAAIVVIAGVAVLSDLGYPVASLLAGLGVGGLAVALAAQKTVENLFGAFSIGLDQPFREGDFVKIDDVVGTVEAVGLRSTRLRTLDRTLVTVPNGKLAEMRVESFTARDRMRLACTVGLVYGTTAAQMREVLDGLERALREHPKIWPDAVVVRFKELAASSLDIEVMAWFSTEDWSEFQLIRQEVLLRFMDVVERAGTSFAFPTQTVHLARDRSGTEAIA
jgi:MscS family membrane protein